MKTKYIYHLKAIELNQKIRGLSIKKNKDGSISTTEHDLGCYSSYFKAEKAIKKHLDITSNYATYGGFIIYKKKLDDLTNADWNYNNYYSIKSFDGQGNYNSFSFSSSKLYKGSDDKYVKFNSGDMIYSYCRNEFVPSVIIFRPLNKDQWKKRFPKSYKGDYSDDNYLIISNQGHGHIHIPLAFPFFGKLSKKEKIGMIKEAKIYFGEQYKQDKINKIFDKL